VLTVSDHLPWYDDSHLEVLQAKLNTYLAFIESGELLEVYPNARNRRVTISVICKFEPDARGRQFLLEAAATISTAGFEFAWSQLNVEAV